MLKSFMLIEPVSYDRAIQPDFLKNLTLEKAYEHSCYFTSPVRDSSLNGAGKNGLIITVLCCPNRIVPYGIVCREEEFNLLKSQKKVSIALMGGQAVSLTLPKKINIPAESASRVFEMWEKCYDDFKSFMNSAILSGEFEKLVGLGSGLTPAGDDFLVGYIASRRILGKEITFEVDCSRTTKLSGHFLSNALSGKFSMPVINFLKSGDAALLFFGKTSGVATAFGILKGMRISAGG